VPVSNKVCRLTQNAGPSKAGFGTGTVPGAACPVSEGVSSHLAAQ